jgi:hypothetical protein
VVHHRYWRTNDRALVAPSGERSWGASVTDRLVHLAAERVDLWVCRFASDGERGTWRTDLVTCPDCLAGRYSDGTPVRAAVARAARGGEP